jgi:UDP-glucose 4-epimerase
LLFSHEFYRGKSVLITGGAGFIGSTLARALVEVGAIVTLIDNLFPQYGGNLFNLTGIDEKLTLIKGDVRDDAVMVRAITGQQFVFNLAGQTSHMDSMSDPFTDLDINAKAQLAILESARKHNPAAKFVYASTRQIYGKPDYLPVDERHPLRPVDVNGINKLAGEWYHILYSNVYNIRACSLRLTNTYGPRMRIKDARQTFVGIWIRCLIENKPFEVWGGEQLRDYTYVDDCVDAILRCGASDAANGKIFNLGGESVYSLLATANLLVGANNGAGSFNVREYPAERKKIDIGDYYSNYFHIQHLLGWQPRVTLADGLKLAVDYYRQHLQHYI